MSEQDRPAITTDPLEMADNLLRAFRRKARVAVDDPLAFTSQNLGAFAAENLKQAGDLALVSIARDLRRIADHLTGSGS